MQKSIVSIPVYLSPLLYHPQERIHFVCRLVVLTDVFDTKINQNRVDQNLDEILFKILCSPQRK